MTLLLMGSVGICAGTHADAPEGATDTEAPAFHECELRDNDRTRLTLCSRVTVPEDYEAAEGRQLSLRVVRLAAGARPNSKAPLLAVAGGPGQAASEAFLFLDRMLPDVARGRDIYLVDQRGTGDSNRLDCPMDEQAVMPTAVAAEEIKEAALECLARLDGNPALYTTSAAVRDLEAVRKALDIEQWHLFGVSYGTRVVQHYMRQYPQALRTVTMDSAVPVDVALGTDIALHSQRALDAFLARCEADSACNEAYPDLGRGLESLFRRLAEAPENLRYEDLRSGRQREMAFTRDHLVALVRLALYRSDQLSTLPPMLHEAYERNNFTALARSADRLVGRFADSIAIGMHNSVVCTEDVPFFAIDEGSADATARTYMGNSLIRALQATCEVWPRGQLDAGFHIPVSSDIPTLLLNGAADPVTPPDYAESILAHLPRGRNLVAPGQGHFVSPAACTQSIIAQFIHRESVDELDVDCLQRYEAAPLFINFNGPRA